MGEQVTEQGGNQGFSGILDELGSLFLRLHYEKLQLDDVVKDRDRLRELAVAVLVEAEYMPHVFSNLRSQAVAALAKSNSAALPAGDGDNESIKVKPTT